MVKFHHLYYWLMRFNYLEQRTGTERCKKAQYVVKPLKALRGGLIYQDRGAFLAFLL